MLAANGFDRVSMNSIDAVGDRDFIADTLYAITMLGMHLSRLAEDLILYGSSEFGFVRYGDSFSTGSSMMPQKRNPDALELPSGYNKDLQEDKRALFDAVDGMLLLLPAVAGSLETLTFNRDTMAAACTSSMMATDLADYLVRKHVSFREAHGAVGALVREAEEKGIEMTALPSESFVKAHHAFESDVLHELQARTSLAHRDIAGGTGATAVAAQLQQAKAAVG